MIPYIGHATSVYCVTRSYGLPVLPCLPVYYHTCLSVFLNFWEGAGKREHTRRIWSRKFIFKVFWRLYSLSVFSLAKDLTIDFGKQRNLQDWFAGFLQADNWLICSRLKAHFWFLRAMSNWLCVPCDGKNAQENNFWISQKLHPIIVQVYFTISRAEICESGNRYFSEPSGGVCGRGANTSNYGTQASPVTLFPWTRNFSLLFLSSLRCINGPVPASSSARGNPAMD